MLFIKKGDKVAVLSGRDKGKSGKVLFINRTKQRVIVEGVNLIKRHLRKRSDSEPGGIKELPASIALSNVLVFCSYCNHGVRYKADRLADGSKIRVCKRCKRPI
jgi:large subunit ribosomal protein L24